MAVTSEELYKALKTLGISDIHIEKEQAKKIYKKLLLKWHPDSCPAGEERFYNDISSKINAAYDVIEKAYAEGLLGPNAKAFKSYSSTTSSQRTHSNANNSGGFSGTGNSSSSSSSGASDAKGNSSNCSTSGTTSSSSTKTYTGTKSHTYSDPGYFHAFFYRNNYLNFIFLSVCALYIMNAIIKSPQTDIYIELSVIKLIKALAIYYSVYWFIKVFAEEISLLVPAIIAFIIYKVMHGGFMFIYNKIGNSYEWLAMLIFIVLFFVTEYFVHIREIVKTSTQKGMLKPSWFTRVLSYAILFEYTLIFFFGLYSVFLVHKFAVIRNVVIPSWY